MITAMKKLQEAHKIPARTAPEVYAGFNEVLQRHRTRIKFGNRKLTAEALLSAILIDFLDRAAADQERVIRANVGRFEALLADDPDGYSQGETAYPPPTARKPRRKRSG